MESPSILFVCSGNVFRSLAAELALKRALGTESKFDVSSAGTHAKDKPLRADVIEALKSHKLVPTGHAPRLLTGEMLQKASLVIALGDENQRFLDERHGYKAVLFNQVCHGINAPVRDLIDVVPNYKDDRLAASQYVQSAIDHIVESTPNLVAAVQRLICPELTLGDPAKRLPEKPLTP